LSSNSRRTGSSLVEGWRPEPPRCNREVPDGGHSLPCSQDEEHVGRGCARPGRKQGQRLEQNIPQLEGQDSGARVMFRRCASTSSSVRPMRCRSRRACARSTAFRCAARPDSTTARSNGQGPAGGIRWFVTRAGDRRATGGAPSTSSGALCPRSRGSPTSPGHGRPRAVHGLWVMPPRRRTSAPGHPTMTSCPSPLRGRPPVSSARLLGATGTQE
jgi:hypothetical protein